MQHVLTLVAGAASRGLDDSMLGAARAALAGSGAVAVGEWLWLEPRQAADLAFEAEGWQPAEAAVRRALASFPIDLLAQPLAGRRKRLLLADMDSTIITSETLDELAAYAGVGEKVAAISARSMRGEVDFTGSLIERVALLAGLPAEALERSWARVALSPGAATLVRTMRQAGAYTALVSGGFRFFSSRVRALAGFDWDESNELEIQDGRLTGRVLPPIVDRDGKRLALERLTREHDLELADALAVGDGANDRDMVTAAGLGVAYRGKPTLREAARARVDHADLTALLFFQGYRAADFSS